ncbi:MAG TPA: hypothetical protein VGR16_08935 [Thermomicrobiales bacterium]|nr:hypothetical protein [Thermomicrobiales bacterium]
MTISAEESETIEITADPGLARQLAAAEAAGKRAVLVRDGVHYRIDPVDAPEMASSPEQPDRDPWADYDPEKVRQGIEAAAGTITVEEAERMKEYIYAAREAGARGLVAPDGDDSDPRIPRRRVEACGTVDVHERRKVLRGNGNDGENNQACNDRGPGE